MRVLPTSAQFELTYACNNACIFCYNNFGGIPSRALAPAEAIRVIDHLAAARVFSVNFNGGEPMAYEGFFDVAAHAASAGLELHLNTNCTLIGKVEARRLSKHFTSVCTTILSHDPATHDLLSGRSGAHAEVEQGIRALQSEQVYVAVNVPLCKTNAADVPEILSYLQAIGVQTAMVTRIVAPANDRSRIGLSHEELEPALRSVIQFQDEHRTFARVAFPQPYPPCMFSADLRAGIKQYNIPCTIGLNTVRITPNGDVTPCTLVPEPCLGNIVKTPFTEIWERFDGASFFSSRLPCHSCSSCGDLDCCGGGCVGTHYPLKEQS